jgi:hypothetical protein
MGLREAQEQQRYLSGENAAPGLTLRERVVDGAMDVLYTIDEFVPVVAAFKGVARALHLMDENQYVGDFKSAASTSTDPFGV